MKESPIIFSTEMVQAILEGRKSQTRRIIKESYNGCWTNGGPHPCPNPPVVMYPGEIIISPFDGEFSITIESDRVEAIFHCSTLDSVARCPYGQPGDLLYVRETSQCVGGDYEGNDMENGFWIYKADGEKAQEHLDLYDHAGLGWSPSIHMPKEAARLFLKITDIRVECLQDISEADAVAEGCPGGGTWDTSPTVQFSNLWDSIYAKKAPWDSNPWVWVITFERCEKPSSHETMKP